MTIELRLNSQDTALSTAKVTGSEKGHDDHGIAPEHSGHCLGSAQVTGPSKRILLPHEKRLGDCDINMLLSGT